MFVLGLRFAFVLVRIFGDPVEVTFDSWAWPLLLWLFPPWTGLAYVLMWPVVGGVSGAEWSLVALGFLPGIVTCASRAAQQRHHRTA
jgi:hypothetical protein